MLILINNANGTVRMRNAPNAQPGRFVGVTAVGEGVVRVRLSLGQDDMLKCFAPEDIEPDNNGAGDWDHVLQGAGRDVMLAFGRAVRPWADYQHREGEYTAHVALLAPKSIAGAHALRSHDGAWDATALKGPLRAVRHHLLIASETGFIAGAWAYELVAARVPRDAIEAMVRSGASSWETSCFLVAAVARLDMTLTIADPDTAHRLWDQDSALMATLLARGGTLHTRTGHKSAQTQCVFAGSVPRSTFIACPHWAAVRPRDAFAVLWAKLGDRFSDSRELVALARVAREYQGAGRLVKGKFAGPWISDVPTGVFEVFDPCDAVEIVIMGLRAGIACYVEWIVGGGFAAALAGLDDTERAAISRLTPHLIRVLIGMNPPVSTYWVLKAALGALAPCIVIDNFLHVPSAAAATAQALMVYRLVGPVLRDGAVNHGARALEAGIAMANVVRDLGPPDHKVAQRKRQASEDTGDEPARKKRRSGARE